MAADRVTTGDPASEVPELSGAFRPPLPIQEPQTLAGRLLPIVDRIRNIATRLGVRVHRVFLVHAEWTGKSRGEGDLVILTEREILPVPRLRDLTVRKVLSATGLSETGDIIIDRISAKYSEDDLSGKVPVQTDPDQPRTSRRAHEFWWEVVENRPQAPNPVRRRYSPPTSVPELRRGGLEWRVVLTKQDGDRPRSGGPPDDWADP